MRLYEQTGDGKYLELSRFFIEQRGTRPYYYDEEHPETVEKGKEGEIRHWYHQAHLPVREQKEAVGHAVRAVYLYSGMAVPQVREDIVHVVDDVVGVQVSVLKLCGAHGID